jgi:hypothetical protein
MKVIMHGKVEESEGRAILWIPCQPQLIGKLVTATIETDEEGYTGWDNYLKQKEKTNAWSSQAGFGAGQVWNMNVCGSSDVYRSLTRQDLQS